jgi:hypothetical protein
MVILDTIPSWASIIALGEEVCYSRGKQTWRGKMETLTGPDGKRIKIDGNHVRYESSDEVY